MWVCVFPASCCSTSYTAGMSAPSSRRSSAPASPTIPCSSTNTWLSTCTTWVSVGITRAHAHNHKHTLFVAVQIHSPCINSPWRISVKQTDYINALHSLHNTGFNTFDHLAVTDGMSELSVGLFRPAADVWYVCLNELMHGKTWLLFC